MPQIGSGESVDSVSITKAGTRIIKKWRANEIKVVSQELQDVIEGESKNWQPKKMAIILGLPAVLFIVQLLRGSGKEPSIIGATRCAAIDWALYAALITFALLMTLVSVCLQRKEYEYKKSINYDFVPGDFKCTTRNAIKLPIYAMVCGFLTASTGTGPGALFNTLLLQLGCHP